MLHTSNLRIAHGNGFLRTIKGIGAALALAILLPVAASAYTVVLRSGRTLEIPASFTVTRAGITYEYAPGILVTIQMTSIDVAATERANNEPAGTLQSRAEGKETSTVGVKKSARSGTEATARETRTLTDKELEASRARREASEKAYERRRVELGLPSLEETRRQREEETRRLGLMEAQAETSKAQSEAYWRARANELRAEIAATDAEINYVRSKLNERPDFSTTVTFSSGLTLTQYPAISASTIVSTGIGGFPRNRFPSAPPGTNGTMARAMPAPQPFAGRTEFAGAITRNQSRFSGRGRFGGIQPRPFPQYGIAIQPFYTPYVYDNNYYYDQSALRARLQELEAERAGLQARWRVLEEEARRAGAQPGWLRP